ncbi:uncharacterized protein LOC106963625 [Poecilia latipinna]|uniref:uncharacterized protein LOC106963625 n=1 Tax=Poecilia latipinna TaxID=48699 RepID=UPI00072DDF5B|nr:PREDICTED: uncharacterized protein LOC106963625 [Poecilia latipinna]
MTNPNISSSVDSSSLEAACFVFGWTSIIFTTFTIANVLLLLPLIVIILGLALQKWRQNRSYFSSASMSHCDCFTYHSVAMETIGVAGCIVSCCGVFMGNLNVNAIGKYLFFFKWYGEVLFHVLTCLERYVAVVHPITYLRLKTERGLRMRNIVVASVWTLCLAFDSLLHFEAMIYWELSFLMLGLVVISFCSVSVLWVLVRPGPGERGEDRKTVVQSKHRALVTIVSTLAVLTVRVVLNVTLEVVYCSTGFANCVLLTTVFWFHLPSSLVLPILFLYKQRENIFKQTMFSKG